MMRVKIKKINTAESLFLEFMLLLGLFFGYFEVTMFWNLGILLTVALLFICSGKFRKSMKSDGRIVALLILLCIMVILNVLFTGKKTYLSYNLIQIIRPIIITASFYYLAKEKNDKISEFLYSKFYVLNIMWILNLIILGLQVAGTGFMMKASWSSSNSYYVDNCTGLFGGSATHVVLFFTVFMTIYNFEFGTKYFHTRLKRKLFIAYIILTLGLMLYFSTLNENTGIFVFVPLFLGWYYLLKLKASNTRGFKKAIKILKYLLLFVLVFFVLEMIPGISEFINDTVLSRIDGIINFKETNGLGSVERLAIVENALSKGFGWKFGKGLGAASLIGEASGYAGFMHFGLSSIGSFVYLFGLWGYLALVILYSYLLSHLGQMKGKISFFISFAVVNLLCIYTMFLTSSHGIVWSILIFLVLNSVGKEKDGQERNSKKQ